VRHPWDQASKHWQEGKALEAGRILFELLPPQDRPLWAADILDFCRALIPSIVEVDTVSAVAKDQQRWMQGHKAFQAVRGLLLKADNSGQTESLSYSVLFVAENADKLAHNASHPPDRFDEDTGWWLMVNLRDVLCKVNKQELEDKAWSIACNRLSLSKS